jgi:hypothetical protein
MALDLRLNGAATAQAGAPTPSRLGPADGVLRSTLTTTASGGQTLRAYRDRSGLIQVIARSADAEATRTGSVVGRPVALFFSNTDITLFAIEGDRVLRWIFEPSGKIGVTPVLWAPMVISEATAVRDAAGVDHLLVRGTIFGGDELVFTSSNATAMQRTLSDHVAATFGWRPWSWTEEALGQLLSAILAAVLVATSSLPLVWLAAALWARRHPSQAALMGALFGASLVPLGFASAWLLGAERATLLALMGGASTLVAAAALGIALATFALWRRDLEALPAGVLGGALALGLSTATHIFIAFPAWSALAWW